MHWSPPVRRLLAHLVRVRNPLYALLAAIPLWAPLAAKAEPVGVYGVFGNHAVQVLGGVSVSGSTGALGSNGDVNLYGGTNFSSIRGGGSMNGLSSSQTVSGSVRFNGNVFAGTFTEISGSVDAGGNAVVYGSVGGNVTATGGARLRDKITGDVNAGGTVILESFNEIQGNLNTNGDVFFNGGKVLGNLTYAPGGSLIQDGNSIKVNGTITQATSVITPAPFSPVSLPAPHQFSTGGADILLNTFDSRVITPGSYGSLTITGANNITLTAGDYYFDTIKMLNGFVTFNLDSTGGNINIYVAGSINFNSPDMRLNGASFANADPAEVAKIYWETHGSLTTNGKFLGTVYAPYDDIHIRSLGQVSGSLISGHDVILDGGNFKYVPSNMMPIPEPSGLALGMFAAVAMGLFAALRRRV